MTEANRIKLAHYFDPYLAIHTSLVDPLPHQISAVYGEMLPRQPLRFLLADDPGAEAIFHWTREQKTMARRGSGPTEGPFIRGAGEGIGVHLLTGPVAVENAEPGDILEVRYLRMVPRCNFGSNLAANWGYLYKEFGEKERVTIYQLDANAGHAEALYAYDFPGKYLVPGTITNCPVCDRQPALKGVRDDREGF